MLKDMYHRTRLIFVENDHIPRKKVKMRKGGAMTTKTMNICRKLEAVVGRMELGEIVITAVEMAPIVEAASVEGMVGSSCPLVSTCKLGVPVTQAPSVLANERLHSR
jgi:hypothetical protein